MNNSIYIRRKNKVYLEKEQNQLPIEYLLNLLKNIQDLGYTLSEDLIDVVKTLTIKSLKKFYIDLVKNLKELVGAHVIYQPMYANFPEEVKTMSEEELYTNAFMHYLGDYLGLRILPLKDKIKRPVLKNSIKLKVIDLGTKEDFLNIFTNLLSAKTSISETDKSDLKTYISTYKEDIFSLVPDEIPHKENTAIFIATLLLNNIDISDFFSRKYIKTATDILRIVVAFSNGDVSLASSTKFINISKRHRRFILNCLENVASITEDMLRHKEQWKRLGEKLHPSECKNKYPKTAVAFDIIRNDKPFETFNSKVEKALIKAEIFTASEILKTRPGEFARRLDNLIRLTKNPISIINIFEDIAPKVSTPVLLQIKAHFKDRNSNKDLRVFFPKGIVAKVTAIDNNLSNIEESLCQKIVAICDKTLIEKFSHYPPLGKVYLDEKLKNYIVPLSQRSASKALKTIPRGSKVDLPSGNTIRFFAYWKNGNSRTDIDLSALCLATDNSLISEITYYNLREFGAYHSGDITSAPQGASEFLDIEIDKCLAQNIRYVLMSLNSFTSQNYCDLPICFAGFMMRAEPNSGEIYEPKTVENKFDITANSQLSIPLIIDLHERKVIWTDLSLKHNPNAHNNVHNNLSSLGLLNKAMTTNLVKPNLYDLLYLHVIARGKINFDIQNSDTIFAIDKGIKPSDIDILISEFL